MKSQLYLVTLILAIGFSFSVKAEQETKTDSINEDLQKSFQNEYVYLASQKTALKQQKEKLISNLNTRINEAKKQTQALQKQLAWLSADNDEKHEYMMSLEKRKRDLQKKESSLESVYKKSYKKIEDFKSGLYFEVANENSKVETPLNLDFESFEKAMTNSKELLLASTEVEAFPSAFINMEDKLVEGIVTRIGRSAAIGSVNDQYYILGPNGSGPLKALELTNDPMKSSLSLYVFESLSKISKIKKNAGFTEKLADLSPILFLGMMLLLVLGLFMAMMRI